MKKFIRLIAFLAIVIAALTLVACGGDPDANQNLGDQSEQTGQVGGEQVGGGQEGGQEGGQDSTPADAASLVVYFSNTGNTERVARALSSASGADLWEIVPAVEYTSADLNYNDPNSRASRERADESSRPAIAEQVQGFDDYEIIYIGYPIWWGDAPRIIQTFIESYDFGGKSVYTFSTSSSSGGGGAFNALASQYDHIDFVDYLHLTSRDLRDVESRVDSWLLQN